MKRKLAVLTALTILVSILGGCSRGKEKNPALAWIDPFQVDASQKLYYEEIPVADMPYMTEARYVEGKDVFVGLGEGKLYVFDRNGKVLKEIAAGALSYTVSYEGEIYALSQESQKGNNEITATNGKIAVYNLEGNKEKEIKLEDCSYKNSDESGNEYSPQICVDSKGRMSILYPNTVIKILESKGSLEKEVETPANLFLESDTEGSLITGQYYVKSQAPVVDVVKLDGQNNQKWKAQLYSQAVAKSPIIRGEYLYFLDEKGVQRIDSDGKGIYVMLYENHTRIVDPRAAYLCDVGSDRSLYFLINRGESTKLYMFKQSQEAEEKYKNKKTVKVKLFKQTPPFEQTYEKLQLAAKFFNGKQDDFRVEIEVERKPGDTEMKSDRDKINDYVKKLNTEILAGKGDFDIISTYGLPFTKYAEKGVFADIEELMRNDPQFNKGDYYEDVINALKYNGKLYGLPIAFMGRGVVCDMDMAAKSGVESVDKGTTFDEFYNLAGRLTIDGNKDGKPEQYGISINNSGDRLIAFASSFVYSNMKYIMNTGKKEAYFDSKRFAEVLRFIKQINDSGYVAPFADPKKSQGNARDAAVMDYRGLSSFLNAKGTSSSNVKYINYPGFEKESNYQFILGDNVNDTGMLAINSRSGMKKEAWEFIKYLSSEEFCDEFMSSVGTIPRGFSMNKNVNKKVMLPVLEYAKENPIIDGSEDSLNDLLDTLVKSAESYVFIDYNISDLINSAVTKFMSGYYYSAEDIANELQSQINIYLNE